MTSIARAFLVSGVLLLAEVCFAGGENIFFVCERQKEVRWLRVFTSTDGKCRTSYSKDGYTQVVSSASYFSSCEAVMGNIKKNIEDGGFKCSEAKLSSVVELE